jgi:hypothetical protein
MSHPNEKSERASRPTLEDIQKRFEIWRKSRRGRCPIPEELWQTAVDLTQDYPLFQISKALHLSHAKLKERVSASKATGEAESPSFVELDFSKPLSLAECIVEMEEKNGSRMKMHIKSPTGFDLLGLAKAFWSKGSS